MNWPLTSQDLMAHMDANGITYRLYEHPPFFTVAEGEAFKADMPGAHCRNLFVRNDKKSKMVLVCLRNETRLDLKKLAGALGEKRFSFGSPDLLWEKLGVKPGSVCVYAILNNRDHDVDLVLEEGMLAEEIVNFHPLQNDMTIGVKPADILKLLDIAGIHATTLNMTALAPEISE